MKELEVRVIRSEKQYNQYLNEIDQLMDNDPPKNSAQGQLLETLVILVEDYERKRGWDIPIPDSPIDVIKSRMEDLGLKQSDLATVVGDKTVISRIMKGSRKLTYSMIIPLSKLLKIPPELLLERN